MKPVALGVAQGETWAYRRRCVATKALLGRHPAECATCLRAYTGPEMVRDVVSNDRSLRLCSLISIPEPGRFAAAGSFPQRARTM